MCSDGLTNMVSDDQILEIATKKDVEDSCKELIKMSNECGGDDNITVLVFQIDELDEPTKSLSDEEWVID